MGKSQNHQRGLGVSYGLSLPFLGLTGKNMSHNKGGPMSPPLFFQPKEEATLTRQDRG